MLRVDLVHGSHHASGLLKPVVTVYWDIIAQHDDGAAAQLRVADPLTGNVKLVGVRDGDGLSHTPLPSVPVDRVHDSSPYLEVRPFGDLERRARKLRTALEFALVELKAHEKKRKAFIEAMREVEKERTKQ